MSLRNYTNLAPPLALSVEVESNTPTLTVSSTAGYPDPPFLIGLERGTGQEEVVLCTAKTSTTFTVTRGFDNTSQHEHGVGTSVEHTVAAIDFREANAHVNDPAPHVPVGGSIDYLGAVAPTGWVMGDGSWLSKVTYAALWAVAGDAYLDGEAPRADQFRVPDLRQRVTMGAGDSPSVGGTAALGSKGGSKDAILVQHSHNTQTGLGGTHSHGVGNLTGGAGGHDHTHNDAGSHSHTLGGEPMQHSPFVFAFRADDGIATNDRFAGTGTPGITSTRVTFTNLNGVGNHNHGMSNPGDHQHSITGAADHRHGIDTEGVSGTDKNLQPFTVLNKIIKT